MEQENELVTFLNEVVELRLLNRADTSRDLPEIIEVSNKIQALFEEIDDDYLRGLLLRLEALKNEHESIITSFLYQEALKDMVQFIRLIINTFFKN